VEDVTGTLPARSARVAWRPTAAGAPTAGICPGLEDGAPGSKDAFGGDAYFPFLDFAQPVRRSRLLLGLQDDLNYR